MPTDAKRQAVDELAEMLRGSSAIAVADYRGLKVADMQTVRRSLRANGVELHVAKNRLLKIAADKAEPGELKPMLEGPTALATDLRRRGRPGQGAAGAFRPYQVVTVRGGLLGGQRGRRREPQPHGQPAEPRRAAGQVRRRHRQPRSPASPACWPPTSETWPAC